MTAIESPKMAFDEAQALFAEIRTAQDNWFDLVIKAHDGKAWAAVGYRSWEECVRTEFKISKRHADRIVQFGKVYDVIAEVGPVGPITVSHTRELGKLTEPDDQRAAFTAAQEAAAAEGKPMAARHVEAAVEQIKPKPKRNGAGSQLERDRLAAIARAVEPPPHGPGTISDAELDAGDGGDPVSRTKLAFRECDEAQQLKAGGALIDEMKGQSFVRITLVFLSSMNPEQLFEVCARTGLSLPK